MARLQSEIYDSLKAALDADETLSALLTDESNIATYNQMLNIVAGEIAILEQTQDNHSQVVEDRAMEGIFGSEAWHGWASINVFQYGDTLVFADGEYGYAVEDDTLKVVDFAAAETEGGRILIKAAKSDADGLAEALSTAEKTGLQGFWDKYNFQKPIIVVSQAGDEVYLQASIEYNADVLGSSGESLSDTSIFPVEDAINNFYSSFQNDVGFANIFYVRKLEDAIQAVDGVVNVVISKCNIKPLGGSYQDVLATAFKKYSSAAGWVQEDSANLLSANLSYSSI